MHIAWRSAAEMPNRCAAARDDNFLDAVDDPSPGDCSGTQNAGCHPRLFCARSSIGFRAADLLHAFFIFLSFTLKFLFSDLASYKLFFALSGCGLFTTEPFGFLLLPIAFCIFFFQDLPAHRLI